MDQRRLLVYTADQSFLDMLWDVTDQTASIKAVGTTPDLLALATDPEWAYAPLLIDLALQVSRSHCDQCVFAALERIRSKDPQRLILAVQSGQDTHLYHKDVFYFVLDKQDIYADPKSIISLVFTQQAIRRASSQTSMILSASNPSTPTGQVSEVEQLRASKHKWKSAYERALADCRQLALDTLGVGVAQPNAELEVLPSYWARLAIMEVRAENSRLQAEIAFLRRQ